jgi:hypothetical protein
MTNRYFFILSLLPLLCLTGCGLKDLDDQIIVPAVEDEFYLSLWETLGPEQRELEFRLRTIQDTGCKNVRIDQEARPIPGGIQLSIRELVQAEDCDPGPAPAAGSSSLAALPAGVHKLEVKLRDKVTTTGQLRVDQEVYDISLEKGGGIILLQRQLRRIPPQAVWGAISYAEANLAQAAQSLHNAIAARCEPVFLRSGDYGYFSMQDGVLRLPNTIAPPGAATYHYRYTGSPEEMRDLLDSYRVEYDGKIAVRMFNDQGGEW